MAHSNRSANKARRDKEKRARKEANRALYAELTRRGENQKKKSNRRVAKFSPNKHAHLTANCGNPGCDKCHDVINREWKARLQREAQQ